MKHVFNCGLIALLVVLMSTDLAFARGPRGRGGGGGGGGFRGGAGGGAGGGAAGPNRAFNPPQSPGGNFQPGAGGARPNGGLQPTLSTRPMPGQRSMQLPGFGNPGGAFGPGGQGAGPAGNPTRGDVSQFLGLPPNAGPGRNGPINNPGTPGDRPFAGDRPVDGDRPLAGNGPIDGNRPLDGDRPLDGTRPIDGDRPIDGNRPIAGDQLPGLGPYDHRGAWPGYNPGARPWNGGPHPYFHDHYYAGRYPAGYWWRPATAVGLTGWFVNPWPQPVYYSYGTGGDVYYDNSVVYVGGEPYATADEYYDQAESLATSVPEASEEQTAQMDWMPLGVFAISDQSGQSDYVVQLAVNKQGVITGSYYNDESDKSRPIEGSVDMKTQRAAWTFADGKDTDVIMETMIYNLTEDETTVLVHFGADQTQEWTLTRLSEPQTASTEQ